MYGLLVYLLNCFGCLVVRVLFGVLVVYIVFWCLYCCVGLIVLLCCCADGLCLYKFACFRLVLVMAVCVWRFVALGSVVVFAVLIVLDIIVVM